MQLLQSFITSMIYQFLCFASRRLQFEKRISQETMTIYRVSCIFHIHDTHTYVYFKSKLARDNNYKLLFYYDCNLQAIMVYYILAINITLSWQVMRKCKSQIVFIALCNCVVFVMFLRDSIIKFTSCVINIGYAVQSIGVSYFID